MNETRARTLRRSAIQVIPSARRLVHSLRDLGYDFPQAVADLVDNSITAEATRVAVDLRFEGQDSWLRIADNGTGMAGTAITEAMRYGSQQTYGEEDLGKFGLGLKTASLSQCRKLSVATRRGADRARIEARVLDLDHVIQSNRWEIFTVPPGTRDAKLVKPLETGPGTVALWESLDRILGYKIPTGKRAETALAALGEQLKLHLGMVFHRFLSGEIEGRKRVRILVNGRLVKPWDPFGPTESETRPLPGCDIDVRTTDGFGLVRFQPYVLPPREKFSSEESFHWYAGPRKWNAQQGLYIYRANRMIQSGGWNRLRAPDEHVKLARAAIDFYPDLDSAFEINVAKARAVLPADLRERLREPVESLVRVAQSIYRANSAENRDVAARNRSSSANGGTARSSIEKAARRVGELESLERIVKDLQKSDPDLAQRLGW
jgi:hypothetical protein